jgi:PAS domain S-box-containing protein
VTVDAKIDLSTLFEAAPQGILALASDGRILLVNRRTEEMFGYSRSAMVGQPLEILLPERCRSAHAAHRSAYFAAPRARSMRAGMVLAGRRKDGTEFPVEIGLSSAETTYGVLALGFVVDLTEYQRAADELSHLNAELQRSNAELEQFASIASHDLQEPLRMIMIYLKLLDTRYSGRLDAQAQEFIAYAVDGAARMRALIEALLSFSRAGSIHSDFQPLPAGAIFEQALDNLRAAIAESHARITCDPLPEIVADANLLIQVFQNLIANGIKFHNGGAPRIHVSAAQQDRQWVFSVRDNGIGIEPRHASRIFRIFERLQSAEQYPGTGMGLAIAQKIVERHGGRIWFESQTGNGSTFYFSIPRSATTLAAGA